MSEVMFDLIRSLDGDYDDELDLFISVRGRRDGAVVTLTSGEDSSVEIFDVAWTRRVYA